MANELNLLLQDVKAAFNALKHHNVPLSFVLLIGKMHQGKSTLLKQSGMRTTTSEAEHGCNVYYNANGVIVEISEQWLNQSSSLLQEIIKQLNRCHRHQKISGLIYCVDITTLAEEPLKVRAHCEEHGAYLKRFKASIPYPIDLSLIFTKSDGLAGFCEFFQNEHTSDLKKPLGFSMPAVVEKKKTSSIFNLRFEQFTEMLSQQVIKKMHPARSGLKRTLIREFPLQLATIRPHIQVLLQCFPKDDLALQAIYFTSALQGGVSIDHLNHRIRHEYALVVQDRFVQPNNFKAFFIEGALNSFLQQTQKTSVPLARKERYLIGAVAAFAGLGLSYFVHQYLHTQSLLDEASKDLLRYEYLVQEEKNHPVALFHLTEAKRKIETAAQKGHHKSVVQLSVQMQHNAKNSVQMLFLPKVLARFERELSDPNLSAKDRFIALKTYLMLTDKTHHQRTEILEWLKLHWAATPNTPIQTHEYALLAQIAAEPQDPALLNQPLINDVRNFLNAIPEGFLYYSIAKQYFPTAYTAITIPGFTLAADRLPLYYTKTGYKEITQSLPQIAQKIQTESWVLGRSTSENLPAVLEEAYAFDYINWWKNFSQKSRPIHFDTFVQGSHEVKSIASHEAVSQFLTLIQEHTGPDLQGENSPFNQRIASQFTDINLISQNVLHDLNRDLLELDRFLTTLAVVKDGGQTAFNIARSRFTAQNHSDPLSALYIRANALPKPASLWAKQLADDAWGLIIKDAQVFINNRWQQSVYQYYSSQIRGHYPFDHQNHQDVSIDDFNHFFAHNGRLNQFINEYVKPFLNTNTAVWSPKNLNGYIMPIQTETIEELIRANIIANMFFPEQSPTARIQFSLQKLSLDPIIEELRLDVGHASLVDNQRSESISEFYWPQNQTDLRINSIEGNHYEITEQGPWALFKLFQKMNVLVDEQDSSSLEIALDIGGYSGRYLLRVQSPINPFIPGILNGFMLPETIV